jgi:hypothetical protein
MKQIVIVLILVAVALTACTSDGVYDQAYTASGDGTNELELNRTEQFPRNEDLNVVVKLNSHDSDVEVVATFFDPDGDQVGDPLSVTADQNVGTVVLGLDWEGKGDEEFWEDGRWRVQIDVDGEEVDTLEFRVG